MFNWDPRFEFQNPPGTYSQELPHPDGNADAKVEVGISHEHRFAFYFWGKWIKQYGKRAIEDPPDLITVDWHRDLAEPTNQEKSDLESLVLDDENELSLFCWGYLNPNNDDHVLSAAFKGMIGDIYVLCKQQFTNVDYIKDMEGNKHEIFIFEKMGNLASQLEETEGLVVLDIDLDYFTETDSFMGLDADVELMKEQEIRSLLDPNNKFFQTIFPRLFGMTIALEPKFCGGYQNTCHLFSILDNMLFHPLLLHPSTSWRHLRQ